MSHYAMYTDFDALEDAQLTNAEKYLEIEELESMKNDNLNKTNYSVKIASSITDYFDSEQWSYDFDQDNGIIQISFNTNLKMKSINHITKIEENGFLTNTYIPLNGDKATRSRITELFNLINNDIKIGKFSIDYEDGEIKFSSFSECGDRYLLEEEVNFKYALHEFMYERYEDAILAVLFNLKTPEQAYEDAED